MHDDFMTVTPMMTVTPTTPQVKPSFHSLTIFPTIWVAELAPALGTDSVSVVSRQAGDAVHGDRAPVDPHFVDIKIGRSGSDSIAFYVPEKWTEKWTENWPKSQFATSIK